MTPGRPATEDGARSGPTVTQLWRYPVKSLGGESVDELELTRRGVLGDRQYAIALVDSDRILTAKRNAQLLNASARWLGHDVEIRLPDGRVVRSDDPDTSTVLSDWLGVSVRLDHVAGRNRTVADYAGDLGDPAATSSFDLPAWSFVDEAPVHLLSEGSLRAGRGWYGDGEWDVRRFRPNVLLDEWPDDAAEQDWPDGRLFVGTAALSVTGRCRRCVAVSQPQGGLASDRNILRTVLDRSDGSLGVYANVVEAGVVRVGDQPAMTTQVAMSLRVG